MANRHVSCSDMSDSDMSDTLGTGTKCEPELEPGEILVLRTALEGSHNNSVSVMLAPDEDSDEAMEEDSYTLPPDCLAPADSDDIDSEIQPYPEIGDLAESAESASSGGSSASSSVFRVSVQRCPCRPGEAMPKTFSTLSHSLTCAEVVDRFCHVDAEDPQIVCGLGEEASTVSGEELDHCTLGSLTKFGVAHLHIVCKCKAVVEDQETLSTPVPAATAFDVMMGAARKRDLPPKKMSSAGVESGVTRKDELYNDLIDDLKSRDCLFRKPFNEAEYIIQVLTNALWYVTNQHQVILSAAGKKPGVLPIPQVWETYQGYNEVKRKKLKEKPMTSSALKGHSQTLYSVSLKPCMQSTTALKNLLQDITGLADCLDKYASHLDDQLKGQQNRQSLLHPVRMLGDNVCVQLKEAVVAPRRCYWALDQAVKDAEDGDCVQVNEYLPDFPNATERFRYFEDLHLSDTVEFVKYAPGGSHFVLAYVWKSSPSSQAGNTVKMYEKIRPNLPVFHTRAMKTSFKEQFGRISRVTPSVLESIYSTLAMDSSAHSNPEVGERVRLILLGETGLVQDLRELNSGRPSGTYDVFFEQLEDIIEKATAADDRRHGTAHLAHWISLPDMIRQAADKCPPGTSVPSKDLVRLQFTPKNPFTKAALRFTCRYKVQHKIQVRQLRAAHPDNHFVCALLIYLKELVVMMGSALCTMLFADDKAKVSFGEPGHILSTGVRGRQSLAPTTTTYMAEDHDVNHRGSLTPSVYLDATIPSKACQSFYRGRVNVTVNDSVFQQSCPMRHGAATVQLMRERPGGVTPVLAKFSDGGTDQRITLEHVKCSLIAVFKVLNLDLLLACRCSPGQSWINTAERCMSLLNLALQNCALERPSSNEAIEKRLKQLGGTAAIREAGHEDLELAHSWSEAVQPLQKLVNDRFKRLRLKEEPVHTFPPVPDFQMKELKDALIELFPGIDLSKLTKLGLKKMRTYHDWVSRHCIQRLYSFQIRKCRDPSCCDEPVMGWEKLNAISPLPDPVLDDSGEHYMKFVEVYEKPAAMNPANPPSTEPILKPPKDKPQVAKPKKRTTQINLDPVKPAKQPSSLFTTQNGRALIGCIECKKPRLVYAKHPLTDRQHSQLAILTSETEYSCGAPLTAPGGLLHNTVFARLPLHCGDPVEVAYYKTGYGAVDICSFCGEEGGIVDRELWKKYKTVLPMCPDCEEKGCVPVCYMPYGKFSQH